jgi:hypothetical protein
MDMNEYLIEREVRDRLTRARAEARAAAERRALPPVRRSRRLRGALGVALIALGQWLVEATPAPDGTRA